MKHKSYCAGLEVPYSSDIALVLVAQIYAVNVDDIRSTKRCHPRVALARQIAMYLSRIVLEMSFTEIGFAFGRNRSTAFYALHHVENMRDDPELDRTLRQLETLLRQTVGEAA